MAVATSTKDDLLSTLASSIVTVGLFDGNREIEDVRYQRQPVEFGESQGDDGLRFVENVNEIQFLDMGKNHDVTHFGLFGLEGEIVLMFALLRPHDPLFADDVGTFRAGSINRAGSIKFGLP